VFDLLYRLSDSRININKKYKINNCIDNIITWHFWFIDAKISDNNAESEKVPRMLAAFPRWIAREILSKRNFFDFESPDSAISRFPMTLIKSMASLHQGPKVSKAKPLNKNKHKITFPKKFQKITF
jgi:hypothetical protein